MLFSSCVYLIGQVNAIQFLCIFDRPSFLPFRSCVYLIGHIMPFSSCVYLMGQVYAFQFLCIFDRPSLCHSVLVYI